MNIENAKSLVKEEYRELVSALMQEASDWNKSNDFVYISCEICKIIREYSIKEYITFESSDDAYTFIYYFDERNIQVNILTDLSLNFESRIDTIDRKFEISESYRRLTKSLIYVLMLFKLKVNP